MLNVMRALWNDEMGAILSMELVLVATILVIGLVVGLSEVAYGVVQELNDVGDAIGSLNQSYSFTGFRARKHEGAIKSIVLGSSFSDAFDECDNNQCDITCSGPVSEGPKF